MSGGRSHTWGASTQRGRRVNTRSKLLNLRETISQLIALKETLTQQKLLVRHDVLLLTKGEVGLLNNLEERREREGGIKRAKDERREREKRERKIREREVKNKDRH